MAHSESTRNMYYNVRDPTRGISFAKKILDKVLEPHEHQEREEVHLQVEQASDMEVDEPEPSSDRKRKNNSEIDDKTMTKRQKTTLSTKQKTTFTSTNRNFIRNLFLIDGQTPETLSGNRINEMREKMKLEGNNIIMDKVEN